MSRIGYMRVSTDDQDMALQKEALERAGCDRIYSDKMSGKTTSRPELDEMLELLGEGDELVVWKLDRLGRGTVHLMTLLESLSGRGVEFRSLTENFDTTTPMGRAMIGMMAVFAQLEREVIHERIKAGVRTAMVERGEWGRRVDRERDARIVECVRCGATYRDVAAREGVSLSMVHGAMRRAA